MFGNSHFNECRNFHFKHGKSVTETSTVKAEERHRTTSSSNWPSTEFSLSTKFTTLLTLSGKVLRKVNSA